MDIKDLIYKNRSCRRFIESNRIGNKAIEDLIDLARISASGANRRTVKVFDLQ